MVEGLHFSGRAFSAIESIDGVIAFVDVLAWKRLKANPLPGSLSPPYSVWQHRARLDPFYILWLQQMASANLGALGVKQCLFGASLIQIVTTDTISQFS